MGRERERGRRGNYLIFEAYDPLDLEMMEMVVTIYFEVDKVQGGLRTVIPDSMVQDVGLERRSFSWYTPDLGVVWLTQLFILLATGTRVHYRLPERISSPVSLY
jgi:hypothetical protein